MLTIQKNIITGKYTKERTMQDLFNHHPRYFNPIHSNHSPLVTIMYILLDLVLYGLYSTTFLLSYFSVENTLRFVSLVFSIVLGFLLIIKTCYELYKYYKEHKNSKS
jgi:hypothetical protein